MTQARLTGSIRIIAGQWRSRKINFPATPGLRPTHDRIRETLFNWLSPYIAGANCLDLFAGSGALGFEALSRGAKQVTFIDNARVVVDALQKNAALLKTDKADFILADCPERVPALSYVPFDVVFLDPPFEQGLIPKTLRWLDNNSLLSPSAFIYIEIEKKAPPLLIPSKWELFREKKTPSLMYCLFRLTA